MAGARQSKAYHRRQQQAQEHAQQRRITLAALGVLLAVVILLGVGVVLTVVLPPRAHVLTVGDRTFTAQDVAQRAEFAVLGGDQAALNSPATAAIDAMIRDETVLQAGAALVAPVTDDDLREAIRTSIGVAADLPQDVFATTYQSTYQAFLRSAPLSQAVLERMVRAQVLDDRLVEHFRSGLPAAGPQFQVQRVQSADRSKLQALHDAVVGGAEFSAQAVELGLAKAAAAAEPAWLLAEDLGELKDAVTALAAGGVSDVSPLDGGAGFVVVRMAARDELRAYGDAERARLARRQLDGWIEQQRETLHVREDLSGGEQSWIVKRVQRAAQRARG